MKMRIHQIIRLAFNLISLLSCTPDYEEPEVSLESYKIEDGFKLSVVAAEPFLEAPVSMDFDLQGRIWVAEMRGYMTNIDGDGEQDPSGRISILEDLDMDGVVDHSKVFLDSLVLPRALALVYGGLLYAEPPNLWFVEIEDDKPINRVLVDSLYSDDGNVEHQPNGLMMNIDNWIYNANTHFRYQRKNGKWIKEVTSYRGQWGITKDNFGRLYYNNNSTLLQGDFVLPNTLINNEYYRPQFSIGKSLTSNQRVYPLHSTSVNRGYSKGVLDEDSILVNATSACGPLVYRGDQFPEDYLNNAFVCAPEVNLIKRHVLSFDRIQTTGEQAWKNKEFLSSTDEAFRPVNLFNGPDGAMYIVDMHRGVIQHKAYMTDYLREHLIEKGLDQVIGMGRILKVENESRAESNLPDLEKSSNSELVEMLLHKNGWIRDKAQQLLIHKSASDVAMDLEEMCVNEKNPIAQIHALHTMNGLDRLSFKLLLEVTESGNPMVVAHALRLLEIEESNQVKPLKELAQKLVSRNDTTINLYLVSALGRWSQISNESFLTDFVELSSNESNPILLEAFVNSLSGKEEEFIVTTSNNVLSSLLSVAIENRKTDVKNWIHELESIPEDDRTRGLRFFKNICTACHGPGGTGIESLAPPLIGSEYVSGPGKRLALIVLHGLKGPVNVNGVRYEFNTEMPGIIANPEMSDQDIADLIIYLSNAFGKSRREVNADIIKELRKMKPESGAFTEEELLKIEF